MPRVWGIAVDGPPVRTVGIQQLLGITDNVECRNVADTGIRTAGAVVGVPLGGIETAGAVDGISLGGIETTGAEVEMAGVAVGISLALIDA